LQCTNSACGERSPSLTEGIPVVANRAARERAEMFDACGPLPGRGQFAGWLSPFEAETPGFVSLARAAVFLRAMRAGYEEPFYAELSDALLRPVDPLAEVLDVGCGAGNLAFELARRTGARVTGLDLDAHLLRWAERLRDGGAVDIPVRLDAGHIVPGTLELTDRGGFEQLRFLCSNLLDPPFEPESFDVVTLVNVLDAVPYPRVALRQAVALLKPGGHLIFGSPDSWNASTTPRSRWLATTPPGWDRVLAAEGLEIVTTIDDLEWRLQDTPRLHHLYRVHGRLLRKD
jgi:2-polyprenyl-3-methyl-5-hydroxy-6-metoxy-1,4-benzoquinol methylase